VAYVTPAEKKSHHPCEINHRGNQTFCSLMGLRRANWGGRSMTAECILVALAAFFLGTAAGAIAMAMIRVGAMADERDKDQRVVLLRRLSSGDAF
jgi:hypothetical protein